MNVSICNVRNYGGMTVYHSAPNASDSIKPHKERMPASRRCMCEIITPCNFFDNITFFRRPSEHRLNMQTQPPDTAKKIPPACVRHLNRREFPIPNCSALR